MARRENSYSYFENRSCVYFPCHKFPSEQEAFNCLFCYCPLYALGSECGGNFTYTETGIKDCSHCILPHTERGYDYIQRNFGKVAELAKNKEKQLKR